MAWFIPIAASMLTSKMGGGQQNNTPGEIPHSQSQSPQMNSPMNWLQTPAQTGQVDPMKHLMNLLNGYQSPQQ
jgi:hypothetical protein